MAQAMAEVAASVAARRALEGGNSESPITPVPSTTNKRSSMELSTSKWAMPTPEEIQAQKGENVNESTPPPEPAPVEEEEEEEDVEEEDRLALRAAIALEEAEEAARELAEAEEAWEALEVESDSEEAREAKSNLIQLHEAAVAAQERANIAVREEQEAFEARRAKTEAENRLANGVTEENGDNSIGDSNHSTSSSPLHLSGPPSTVPSNRRLPLSSADLDPATRSMRALLRKPLSESLIELRQPVAPPIIAVEVESGRKALHKLHAINGMVIRPSKVAAAAAIRISSAIDRSRKKSKKVRMADENKQAAVKYI